MFYLYEMPTKRIKVRKYLQRVKNDQKIQAKNIEATFNKKDYAEIKRLHTKCSKMNTLFVNF